MKNRQLLTTSFVVVVALSGLLACAKPRELVRSLGHTTYYVDSAQGNDQNDGSAPEKAWKSLDRVNSTIYAPGDKILFKAGSRFRGQLAPPGSGKEGAPIITVPTG